MPSAQMILAICTAAITATVTLIAVYLTNRGNNERLRLQLGHDKETKDEAIRREKLEELHVVSQKWSIRLISHLFPYMRVMEGEIDYNKALEMTIEGGKEDTSDFFRLQMLVDLYFRSLKEPLQELLLARDGANDVLSSHKIRYKRGDFDGRPFVAPMQIALDRVIASSEKLRDAIVLQSRHSFK